jgi:hypothetical protein
MSVLAQLDGVKMTVPFDLWKYRMPLERRAVTMTPYTFDMMSRVYGLSPFEVAHTEHVLLSARIGEIVNSVGLAKIFDVDAGSM